MSDAAGWRFNVGSSGATPVSLHPASEPTLRVGLGAKSRIKEAQGGQDFLLTSIDLEALIRLQVLTSAQLHHPLNLILRIANAEIFPICFPVLVIDGEQIHRGVWTGRPHGVVPNIIRAQSINRPVVARFEKYFVKFILMRPRPLIKAN